MCYITYTLHKCNHWVPQPQENNGPILRICEEAEELRLGHPCPETQREHQVVNRSAGLCKGCMWKKVVDTDGVKSEKTGGIKSEKM